MNELALKYGCNPNQKPSRIYMEGGSDLPVTVTSMTAVLNRLVRIMPVRWRLIRHWGITLCIRRRLYILKQ